MTELFFGPKPIFFGAATLAPAPFPIRVGESGNLLVRSLDNRSNGDRSTFRRDSLALGDCGRKRFNRLGGALRVRPRGGLPSRRSRRRRQIVFRRTLSGHVVYYEFSPKSSFSF